VSRAEITGRWAIEYYYSRMVTDAGGYTSSRLTDHVSIGVLARIVDRDTVDEVIDATGAKERRSRLLPAHVVVYFVLAMAIFHDGYEEVLRKVVSGLQFLRYWRKSWDMPTTGAISQARDRLGEAPLKELFERVAVPLAPPGLPGAWLRSWRLTAIDGVVIDIPDTAENNEAFRAKRSSSESPFPQVRMVGLGEAGTHAVVAAQIGSSSIGERQLALGLLPAVEADMLVLADRGFFSFEMWQNFLATGAALLWRVRADLNLPVVEMLSDGTYQSVIKTKRVRGSRFQVPLSAVSDPRDATHIPVRVIEYTITGTGSDTTEIFRLITSVTDPNDLTAIELATAYHQRWEYELALREIKAQLLDHGGGLRSKKPHLIHQEIWGLLIAHYAIRALMVEAAETRDLDPDNLSFLRTLNLVRRQVINQAGFSPRNTRPSTP